jgi:hypothetical protein
MHFDSQEDHHMHAFHKMLVGAVALAAFVPSAALAQGASNSGPGVPRGQIEAAQYTVEITGSNAVARHERTRQWLTADRSHTVTRAIPTGKLRFEGATSPFVEFRFDAASDTLFVGKGFKTPPYLSQAQQAHLFARSVAGGCNRLTGETTFEGHNADVYTLVPATSGPCRGDADVGQTIVDKASGTILQRTMGEADGSFMEVDTLESLQMLPLNHTTKKLLAMRHHPGAHVDRHTNSKASS